MNHAECHNTYRRIEALLNRSSDFAPQDKSVFRFCVQAAYVKSLEFNLAVSAKGNYNDAFFAVASLRGICEDLIALSYINTLEESDRSDVAMLYMQLTLQAHVIAQMDYFKENKPSQSVIKKTVWSPTVRTEVERKLRQFGQKYSWGSRTFHSVSHMATQARLVKLYNYLYHATSDFVHFSPHVLLRMGWGDGKSYFNFSTRQFSDYYRDFAPFYGTVLFLEFHKRLSSIVSFAGHVDIEMKELKKAVKQTARWPEIVTLEEMNRVR